MPDNRTVNDQPQGKLGYSITGDFKDNAAVGSPPVTSTANYSHIMTVAGWNSAGGGGGWPAQVSFGDGMAIRQGTSATEWGSWRTVLHSNNFNSYAPALTGTGASGTWPISVSGNAATSGVLSPAAAYSFSASTNGRDFVSGVQASFVSAAQGYPQYGSVVRVHTYANDGGSAEVYFPYGAVYGGSSMRYRLGLYDNAGWTGWKTVLDSDNVSTYAQAPLVSGTNIKTINGNSILGSGDLVVAAASGISASDAMAIAIALG